jgi:hypothetical protein
MLLSRGLRPAVTILLLLSLPLFICTLVIVIVIVSLSLSFCQQTADGFMTDIRILYFLTVFVWPSIPSQPEAGHTR